MRSIQHKPRCEEIFQQFEHCVSCKSMLNLQPCSTCKQAFVCSATCAMQHAHCGSCCSPDLVETELTMIAVRGIDGTLRIDNGRDSIDFTKPRLTDVMHMLIQLSITPNYVGMGCRAKFRFISGGPSFEIDICSLVTRVEFEDGVVRTQQRHRYKTLESGTVRCGGLQPGREVDPMNLAFVEGPNAVHVTVSLPFTS
jgi:hypothetical protein